MTAFEPSPFRINHDAKVSKILSNPGNAVKIKKP